MAQGRLAAVNRDEFVSAKWERKLENWAVYLASGKNAGRAKISSLYRLAGHGTRGSSADEVIPMMLGEAIDTDKLVRKLEAPLRKALESWYVLTGTQGQKAQALGCHVNTLRNRVEAAKQQLETFERARRIKRAHPVVEMV